VSSGSETDFSRIGTETDSEASKEIDTLVAFENYEQASDKLNSLLDFAPDNPEYRLRLLHLLSAGGEADASKEQEEIVGAMMEGRIRWSGHTQRLTFTEAGRSITREPILTQLRQRIRDVRPGPDGLLYVLTDENPGVLLRIEPAN